MKKSRSSAMYLLLITLSTANAQAASPSRYIFGDPDGTLLEQAKYWLRLIVHAKYVPGADGKSRAEQESIFTRTSYTTYEIVDSQLKRCRSWENGKEKTCWQHKD